MPSLGLHFLFVTFISLFLTNVAVSKAYEIKVHGADDKSFVPPPSSSAKIENAGTHDVIVVGGGLAGLTATLYLVENEKSVLLVEKQENLGGLAFGGNLPSGVRYDRGAAYFTRTYLEEYRILQHIGLGKYTKLVIPEPSDSYFWNGKLYLGIWEDETLKELPPSFELFRSELRKTNTVDHEIPNQPLEEGNLRLDGMTAAEWIRKMPGKIKTRRQDAETARIRKRFDDAIEAKTLDPKDPMKDVVDLMDIYCRSALGTVAAVVSALPFANFYISEIEPRYTTEVGTGFAAELIEKKLIARKKADELKKARKAIVDMQVSALAERIIHEADGVKVIYSQLGKRYSAKAKYVIFAAQLNQAPKIIEGFAKDSKEQASRMEKLPMSNYMVHIVRTEGHPYRATYDTWTRPHDYTDEDFTDLILGLWMNEDIKGYKGMRDFKRDPTDNNPKLKEGIFALYHPLLPSWTPKGFDKPAAEKLAKRAVDRMLAYYGPMLKKEWGTEIEINGVETNMWPRSIHVAEPGFFKKAKEQRVPYRRVFFAHSNLGTPAFEEALFRGHCAADNVLAKLDPDFEKEKWSRCPMEKKATP